MSKILLAEDNEDYCRILIALFQRNAYEVIRVKSGIDAYEYIKNEIIKPNLLITDVMMPGMSGFELLAKLKEDGIIIPSIILTSKQREEDVLRGLEYGAVDYITKPFSPAVVLARVKLALAKTPS
jgi:two-component system alkaline phosphatase synthesis response regulator PhoP